MYVYKGTIKEFFSDKKVLLHWAFSAITMVILIISVDWSTIEKTMTFAQISFNYAYIIAAVIGWFNGSIFMAIMKAVGKKKGK